MFEKIKIIGVSFLFMSPVLVAEEGSDEQGVWNGLKQSVDKVTKGVTDMFAAETDKTADLIEAIEEFCPKFIEIRNEQKLAPEDALISKDKGDYEEDAQDILEEIKDMLFDDKIISYSAKVKELEKEIKLKKIEISGIKRDVANATAVNNLRKAASLEEDIKRINEEDISELESDITAIKQSISKKFHKMGTSLTETQIDHLCSRIDGDEILKAMTMIDIFKQVLERTTTYMESATDDLHTLKQYYSICVLLFEANVYVKQLYIDKVDKDWLPKLEEAKTRMSILVAEITQKIKSVDAKYAASWKANLETNRKGMEAIDFYRKELLNQRYKVFKAKKEAVDQKDLAWNTYETAALGVDLIGLVKSANDAFTLVMGIEMPDLVPVDSVLKDTYNEITAELRNN